MKLRCVYKSGQKQYLWERQFKAVFCEEFDVVEKTFSTKTLPQVCEESWQLALLDMEYDDIVGLKVGESFPFRYKEEPLFYGFVVRIN